MRADLDVSPSPRALGEATETRARGRQVIGTSAAPPKKTVASFEGGSRDQPECLADPEAVFAGAGSLTITKKTASLVQGEPAGL